ncbi:unnamed protein product [Vitrella brassicaformis CCMP3155]|uniref:CBM20 domain-containing protein n=1 Tax=Vitrella brassicaformis (strain CCMP3155) TaxID=1169540 RepID=A0A0G4EJX3_VITBC|nr:unnamed protein product [Vitrella brassicaformis CCMP3155]|eukprot:CEL97052.1 unnamed protein product [Vitrella brassicaformis CCMP3155]
MGQNGSCDGCCDDSSKINVIFRVQASDCTEKGETLAILGTRGVLGGGEVGQALRMEERRDGEWAAMVRLDAGPVEYIYVNLEKDGSVKYEAGGKPVRHCRRLMMVPEGPGLLIQDDIIGEADGPPPVRIQPLVGRHKPKKDRGTQTPRKPLEWLIYPIMEDSPEYVTLVHEFWPHMGE